MITTASIVNIPMRSAAVAHSNRRAPLEPHPSVRPVAIAHAISSARLNNVPIKPKSANVSTT